MRHVGIENEVLVHSCAILYYVFAKLISSKDMIGFTFMRLFFLPKVPTDVIFATRLSKQLNVALHRKSHVSALPFHPNAISMVVPGFMLARANL
jgi:hypothetical protein